MKYALETLDILITVTINPSKTNITLLSEEVINEFIVAAKENKESVRLLLMNDVFTRVNETELELLINQYQASIIRLLDTLFNFQRLTSTTPNARLYFTISSTLEELLGFIQQYFTKYLNLNQKASGNYLLAEKNQLVEKLNVIKAAVSEAHSEQELIDIVFSYFSNSFSFGKTNFTTYRQVIYANELIRELSDLISGKRLDFSIKDLLLYLDFNHIAFFKYLIDTLQRSFNNLQTTGDKINSLKYQRKLFRQMHINPDFTLFSKFTSVKEQVLNWVEEEILFMQSQIASDDQEPVEKDIETLSETKISVALSVAQLGVLIRVLISGKVVTNNNQLDVIKVFASTFKTYKTNDISYGSLYGKYYKPETSAIKEVKRVLLHLVGLITQM